MTEYFQLIFNCPRCAMRCGDDINLFKENIINHLLDVNSQPCESYILDYDREYIAEHFDVVHIEYVKAIYTMSNRTIVYGTSGAVYGKHNGIEGEEIDGHKKVYRFHCLDCYQLFEDYRYCVKHVKRVCKNNYGLTHNTDPKNTNINNVNNDDESVGTSIVQEPAQAQAQTHVQMQIQELPIVDTPVSATSSVVQTQISTEDIQTSVSVTTQVSVTQHSNPTGIKLLSYNNDDTRLYKMIDGFSVEEKRDMLTGIKHWFDSLMDILVNMPEHRYIYAHDVYLERVIAYECGRWRIKCSKDVISKMVSKCFTCMHSFLIKNKKLLNSQIYRVTLANCVKYDELKTRCKPENGPISIAQQQELDDFIENYRTRVLSPYVNKRTDVSNTYYALYGEYIDPRLHALVGI